MSHPPDHHFHGASVIRFSATSIKKDRDPSSRKVQFAELHLHHDADDDGGAYAVFEIISFEEQQGEEDEEGDRPYEAIEGSERTVRVALERQEARVLAHALLAWLA